MAIFLGIDAGGTYTRCVVGDEHRVLGTAHGSSCKIQRVGEAEARRALYAVVREAIQAAGVTAKQIEHACIGISGASDPDVAAAVRRILGEVIPAPVEVVGDVTIALEAAFGGGAGCIVIAGTGSIAVGRNGHGDFFRAGGWGPATSDEGSGYWIGRAAAAAVLRAHDAGTRAALLTGIMERWGLAAPEDFLQAVSASPPPDFAQLFPTVKRFAEEGDTLAGEIIASAGLELAKLALLVVRRLWPREQRVRVAIAGGVLQNSALLRQAFVNAMRNAHSEIAVSFGNVESVMGALAMARRSQISSLTAEARRR
ncbi:MAG TPA: BadF/BadG/BcrA/BcrD ATPase family protein [Terriglobales bacterium]|jgi:glucosamine kinase|nr:BadF/BadG/BcrA/BcrD ATPase family protein [Terriglobales bacterium]